MTSRNWAGRPRKSLANSWLLNLTYVCAAQWIQAFINLNTNICSMHTNNSIWHICWIVTHRASWWWFNPNLCADPGSNRLISRLDEGFCYFSDTSLMIPSEGQKLLLHSMYLSPEEVSLEEHSAPQLLPITGTIILNSIDSFRLRREYTFNQQQ